MTNKNVREGCNIVARIHKGISSLNASLTSSVIRRNEQIAVRDTDVVKVAVIRNLSKTCSIECFNRSVSISEQSSVASREIGYKRSGSHNRSNRVTSGVIECHNIGLTTIGINNVDVGNIIGITNRSEILISNTSLEVTIERSKTRVILNNGEVDIITIVHNIAVTRAPDRISHVINIIVILVIAINSSHAVTSVVNTELMQRRIIIIITRPIINNKQEIRNTVKCKRVVQNDFLRSISYTIEITRINQRIIITPINIILIRESGFVSMS